MRTVLLALLGLFLCHVSFGQEILTASKSDVDKVLSDFQFHHFNWKVPRDLGETTFHVVGTTEEYDCFKNMLHKYTDRIVYHKQLDDESIPVSDSDRWIFFGEETLPSQGIKTDVRSVVISDKIITFKGSSVQWSSNACLTQEALVQVLLGGLVRSYAGVLKPSKNRLAYLSPDYFGLNGPQFRDSLDEIAQQGIDSMAYPGCQISIQYRGAVIYQKSFGYQTYDKSIPVDNDQVYDLASVTKILGGTTALMKLESMDDFDHNGKWGDYFDGLTSDEKAQLPLQRILSHQAGLEPYIVYWAKTKNKKGSYKRRTFRSRASKCFSTKIHDKLYLHRDYTKSIYNYISASTLKENPSYKYSGLLFLTIPRIVEKASEQRIDHFLKSNLYAPLGMTKMGFQPLKRLPIGEIVPTEYDSLFRKQLVHGYVHDEAAAMLDGLSTNAGLFSNANDMAKLAQLYLNKGVYGSKSYLDKKVIETYTACQFCAEGNHRGLGFDKPYLEDRSTSSYQSAQASMASYGHSGFTGTVFWVDPSTETGFIFLSNRVYPTRKNGKLVSLRIRARLQDMMYRFLGK